MNAPASPTARPRVLVLGDVLPHAQERLTTAFDVVAIASTGAVAPDDSRLIGVRGVATFFEVVDAALIDHLPELEIVASFGVGYDNVAAAHAATRGVIVTNTPDVLTEEVADTAIGLLLNTVRELPQAERWLRAGCWVSTGPYPLSRGTLRGRHVGIYGLGRIGRAVARRLDAFGVEVSYHSRRPVASVSYAYQPSVLDLATAVDTLIVVVPGGPATAKTVDADVLAALGPDGVLVNIGRGSIVDDAALIAALADGTILAAGLDVFADEPHVPAALLDLPNVCLLPHVASASSSTRGAMADLVIDNLCDWFAGRGARTPVAETADLPGSVAPIVT